MIHTRNLTYIYVLLVAVALCSIAMTAHAASGLNCTNGTCTYTPLEPLPTGDANAQNGQNFPAYVSGMFRVLITFGGLFAVVMLVVAGIGYMLSESALDIEKAKDRAKAALWGLLLLTGSWLILNTINPELLKFKLVLPANSGAPTALSSPVSPSAQQNLGDPAKPSMGNAYGFSNLSSDQGYAVRDALGCSWYNAACLGASQYITYNPSLVNTPEVQKAIANYNSNCSGFSNAFVGNVKTIDGAVVGATGQTALVCAGPFQ